MAEINNQIEVNEIHEQVRQTIDQLGPSLVRQQPLFDLLKVSAQEPERISEVICLCPTLSARVLSVINSAALGMPRHIYSVSRAVNLLGAARARTLAMAHGLKILNEASGLPVEIVNELWFNSLVKACAAKMFCQIVEPNHAEEAFCLALIQDIGLAMLLGVDASFYQNQMTGGGHLDQWCEKERDHFGVDHAQVGKELLDQWGTAEHLVTHVANHHQNPLQNEDDQTQTSPIELALFFASLLPHYQEQGGGEVSSWLGAIHAKFMTDDAASPDEFVTQVIEQARLMQGRSTETGQKDCQKLKEQLGMAVCDDAQSMVGHIYQLESNMLNQQRHMADLKNKALTDPLTGVLNRRGFTNLAERHMEMARQAGKGICVLLIDLDEFKQTNDTFGHQAGDEMLAALANLMRSTIRGEDIVGRLGGDEFALVLSRIDAEVAQKKAQRLLDHLNGHEVLFSDNNKKCIQLSIGAAFFPFVDEQSKIDDLLSTADAAMYHCKRQGKGGMRFVACNLTKPDKNTELVTSPIYRSIAG